jgi:hypothetical protein
MPEAVVERGACGLGLSGRPWLLGAKGARQPEEKDTPLPDNHDELE